MARSIRPASAVGRWAFGLGIATATLGALLTSLPQRLGPALEGFAGRGIWVPVGLSSVILELILAASALAVGVVAFRRGERSWLALIGFILAVIIGGFWILFALGEVLAPH